MQEIVVITVVSNDKPGVVEAIAQAINKCGGNWLESKLAQMAGKFVGVIQVSVDQSDSEILQNALSELSERGIQTTYDSVIPLSSVSNSELSNATRSTNHDEIAINGKTHHSASFHAVGPDRKGIIKELSSAFLAKNINVQTLETKLSSMPYSGDPLFEASGLVDIPEDSEDKESMLNALHQQLDDIANDLGIDISLTVGD